MDNLSEMFIPTSFRQFQQMSREINTVDNRKFDTVRIPLQQALSRYGFRNAGSGKYGSVYINPRYDWALKVFMKDTAYLKWVNFCYQHSDNPYCPKFKGRVVKISENIMAIRIEKLQPLRSDGPAYDDFKRLYGAVSIASDQDVPVHDQNLSQIIDFLRQHHNLVDLHQDNCMIRRIGASSQLVVIDPLYNWYVQGKGFTIDPDDVKDLNIF